MYKDGSGKTPVLATVKEAERRLLEGETTKSYLPMPGDPTYGALVQKLMFGDGHAIVDEGRGVGLVAEESGRGALEDGRHGEESQRRSLRCVWMGSFSVLEVKVQPRRGR